MVRNICATHAFYALLTRSAKTLIATMTTFITGLTFFAFFLSFSFRYPYPLICDSTISLRNTFKFAMDQLASETASDCHGSISLRNSFKIAMDHLANRNSFKLAMDHLVFKKRTALRLPWINYNLRNSFKIAMDQLALETALDCLGSISLRNTFKVVMDQLALETPLRLPCIN